MGFTTGLLSGLTLTSTLLYLTVSHHHLTRSNQRALIHRSTLLLTNIVEPLPPLPEPVAREARGGLVETAKDIWNRELEGLVRRAQGVRWREVEERVEGVVGGIVGKVREEGGSS
ncbi:hypothetical protein M501DRAFT_1014577 [Patellaria atrata CBS 101060]|uniref:MICOS complex subunit MIC12 n=1 Tax=Patellaria atrata CBS 101060 TaxID=1346257 RepID=A0A9P4SDF1_9PEZI|nr:hypothetical protein M501DRAFT_1014577 [Patellaria atrata CBS 101060]